MKIKKLLIIIVILMLSGAMLFDLHFFLPVAESQYSNIKNFLCFLTPGKTYKPIKTPRKTDDLGGYYCVTEEEYKNDVPL